MNRNQYCERAIQVPHILHPYELLVAYCLIVSLALQQHWVKKGFSSTNHRSKHHLRRFPMLITHRWLLSTALTAYSTEVVPPLLLVLHASTNSFLRIALQYYKTAVQSASNRCDISRHIANNSPLGDCENWAGKTGYLQIWNNQISQRGEELSQAIAIRHGDRNFGAVISLRWPTAASAKRMEAVYREES